MQKMVDMIDEFIFDAEVRNLTKKTIKGYRNNMLYFNKYLESEGVTDFENVTTVLIKRYIRKHQGKNAKTSYINSTLKVIKAFYKWAVYENYINETDNPARNVKYLKGEKPLIKTFTNDEVKGMMEVYRGHDYLSMRNKAILAVLFDTGIRNHELCSLNMESVKDTYIVLWGKGRKERVVTKSPYLCKVLKRYERVKMSHFELRTCDPDPYFLSKSGKRLTGEAVERIVRKAGEEAGIRNEIRCSPHTCRHYFAQTQLLNGNDIYSISRLLGHSNISITKTYIQSMSDNDILSKGVLYSPLMNLNGQLR